MRECTQFLMTHLQISAIVAHDMRRAISATGKTKVGGNANFVLIRKVRFAG